MKRFLLRSLLVSSWSIFCGTHISLAQEQESNNQTLALWIENDSPSARDKDYTSGVRIAYTQPLNQGNAASNFFEPLTSLYHSSEQTYVGYSLTHMLFTPEDFTSYTQPIGERRYAAWIGTQVALIGQSDNHQSVLGFTLGATGKPALGEKIQDVIHDVTNSPKFNGWDNEIPSELTLGLNWSHLQNIDLTDELSIIPGVILEVGNFRTQALVTMGTQYKLWGLTDPFTLPFVSSTGYTTPNNNTGSSSLSLYASISEYFVVHDVTLDGSIFHNNDTGNKRESFIFQGSIGLRYQTPHWLVTLSYLEMTDAYSTQTLTSKMANLNIAYFF